MALSSSFGFTNTSPSSTELVPTNVDLAANYAVSVDDPGKCTFKNITGPIDQVETISFMSQELNQITQEEKNANPPKTSGGRYITIKAEAKKRVTSTTDDTFIQDFPVSCNVSFRFSKSQYVTADDLLTMLKRVIGAIQAAPDGVTFVLDQLMMGQLNPTR